MGRSAPTTSNPAPRLAARTDAAPRAMTAGFEAVTPERAGQIMRAWAHQPWPMGVQDGIDVCTSLGSTGGPRDPESFASDMRDRLLGNGALPLSSSVPGAQPVRTACCVAAHSRSVPLAAPLPAAGSCHLPRRTGAPSGGMPSRAVGVRHAPRTPVPRFRAPRGPFDRAPGPRRPLRARGARPARVPDRQVQPALLLLHAARGPGLAALRGHPHRRGGRPPGPHRRRGARDPPGPVHRGRAAAAPGPGGDHRWLRGADDRPGAGPRPRDDDERAGAGQARPLVEGSGAGAREHLPRFPGPRAFRRDHPPGSPGGRARGHRRRHRGRPGADQGQHPGAARRQRGGPARPGRLLPGAGHRAAGHRADAHRPARHVGPPKDPHGRRDPPHHVGAPRVEPPPPRGPPRPRGAVDGRRRPPPDRRRHRIGVRALLRGVRPHPPDLGRADTLVPVLH